MTSTPQISFVAREWVKDRLLDPGVNGYNAFSAFTCNRYGIPAWSIDDSNLILGRYDEASLARANGNQVYPYWMLSVGKTDAVERSSMKITPSTYSGMIILSLDFYTSDNGSSLPADGDATLFAHEEALIGSLNCEANYSTLNGLGLIYNNELMIDNDNMIYDGTRWLQKIYTTIVFRLIT